MRTRAESLSWHRLVVGPSLVWPSPIRTPEQPRAVGDAKIAFGSVATSRKVLGCLTYGVLLHASEAWWTPSGKPSSIHSHKGVGGRMGHFLRGSDSGRRCASARRRPSSVMQGKRPLDTSRSRATRWSLRSAGPEQSTFASGRTRTRATLVHVFWPDAVVDCSGPPRVAPTAVREGRLVGSPDGALARLDLEVARTRASELSRREQGPPNPGSWLRRRRSLAKAAELPPHPRPRCHPPPVSPLPRRGKAVARARTRPDTRAGHQRVFRVRGPADAVSRRPWRRPCFPGGMKTRREAMQWDAFGCGHVPARASQSRPLVTYAACAAMPLGPLARERPFARRRSPSLQPLAAHGRGEKGRRLA